MRPLNPCLLVCSIPNAWLCGSAACGNKGHIDTRMQRSSSWYYCWVHRPVPAQTASVLTTQSRYESRFAQEDDSTSPTIMAIARTKGYTVKTDIFKLNRFPTTTHAGAGYSLSLYWDCTVLFMHGHNNNNLLLLLTRERDPQGTE